MKITKLLLAIALVLSACLPSFAMDHYVDTVTDRSGNSISGVRVTIYIAGTNNPASIFADNGVTAKANPFTNNANGTYDFFAADGSYDIYFSRSGTDFTDSNAIYRTINLFDAASYVATGQNVSSGGVVPTTCTKNNVFFDTDEPGGPVLYICGESSTYIPVLVVTGNTLQSVIANDRTVTTANSSLTCPLFGDGVNSICPYADPAEGAMIETSPVTHKVFRIPYGKKGFIWDAQGSKTMVEMDPNGISTGSGTVTLQTDQQIVTSNLGLKLGPSDSNPTCSAGVYGLYADTSETQIRHCTNGTSWPFAQEGLIRKTVDETVNASTTLQNDNELLFSAAANTTYGVKLFILYDSSTTADFKYTFTLPASATGWKATTSAPLTTTTCSGTSGTMIYNDITQTNGNVGGAGNGTANICAMTIEATVVTAGSSGNVTFQWAQNTSDATDTKVRANSWLTYRRIP